MKAKRSAKRRGLPPSGDARQRMMMLGCEALAEVELLAIVLRGQHASMRAIELLCEAGSLVKLAREEPAHLARIPGVGLAGASAIVAALELGRRAAQGPSPYAREIGGPGDVAEYLRTALGTRSQEMLLVLGLDVRTRLRMIRTVAVGSLTEVRVHPREVFAPLVRASMHSVILAHNHPSGEAEPSEADVMLTHRMVAVGRLLGIHVLDHIVVTRTATISLADLGMLEPRPVAWPAP